MLMEIKGLLISYLICRAKKKCLLPLGKKTSLKQGYVLEWYVNCLHSDIDLFFPYKLYYILAVYIS